ncbi:MAG: HAMP domain-containing histidine kinase [Oscillospiraceae bacterium]|nr:HAMP domain-containing histidine kinase [Oscillospiraceae bacterium]
MKTTFSRTFTMAAVVLLAALLLVGASFQLLVRNLMTRQTEKALQDDCTAVASLASAYYGEGSLSTREFFVNLSIATQVSGADAVICDSRGRLVLCSDSPMGCSHQGMLLSEDYLQQVYREGMVLDTGLIAGLYQDPRYVVGMPIFDTRTNRPVGIVILSTPASTAMALLDKLADTYMLVSVLVVLVAVAAITLLARRQSSPLKDMAKAASDFGHGHLDARVSVEKGSPQEVQELALAFNNMAASLQKSEYQRQEFVANVSHELKTPMTTISGYVDGMLDGTIPPERHGHYMELVSQETKRLSRLVRSMLDISRMQDQESIPPESLTLFDLNECVGRVLITFEQKITEKQLEVDADFPEHRVYTRANADAITQVVYNLLDNAVKFCPAGGTLSLKIREGGEKLYVSVGNDGETIPPEELPLVFDRFHKLDKSRAENRDGWGLGLYIVKTLVCRHGEDISVTSQNGKTEFTFTLPLVN